MPTPLARRNNPVADLAEDIFSKAIEEVRYAQQLETKRHTPLSAEEKEHQFYVQGYTPHEHQQKVHDALTRTRFIIVGAGRRGGKTTLVANEVLAMAKLRPHCLIYLVAPTKELVQKAWNEVITSINTRGIKTLRQRGDPTYLVEFENHAVIRGKSAEEPGQLVGDGVDFMVVDEAPQLTRQIWDRYLRPSLADKRGQCIFIGSLEGENWYYDLLEQARESRDVPWEESWEGFDWATWENTAIFKDGFQDPEIQASFKSALDKDDFWEEFGAKAKRPKNLVLPEFNRAVHSFDWVNFDPLKPVYIGIDPGVSNPYAVLSFQEIENCPCLIKTGVSDKPATGTHIWVFDEFYKANTVSEEVIDDVRKRPWFRNLAKAGYGIIDVTDWLGEQRRWLQAGVRVMRVHKTTKDFKKNSKDFYRSWLRDPIRYKWEMDEYINGLLAEQHKTVADLPPDEYRTLFSMAEQEIPQSILLRCSRIHFNSKLCPNAVREHLNWRYAEPKRDYMDTPEEPMKAWDHTVDAAIYYFWERHSRPKRQEARPYLS